MDGILQRGLVPPQFAGRKTNRIDVLRLLAKEVGVRIWEQEDAVIAFDGSSSCTNIAWKARVADWIHVASPHQLADRETRRYRFGSPRRGADRCSGLDIRSGYRRGCLRCPRPGLSAFRVLSAEEPCLNRDVDQSREPSLVVAHAEIIGRRKQLDPVTGRIEVPLAPGAQCSIDRVTPPLP